jgi:hypothetical protein
MTETETEHLFMTRPKRMSQRGMTEGKKEVEAEAGEIQSLELRIL